MEPVPSNNLGTYTSFIVGLDCFVNNREDAYLLHTEFTMLTEVQVL